MDVDQAKKEIAKDYRKLKKDGLNHRQIMDLLPISTTSALSKDAILRILTDSEGEVTSPDYLDATQERVDWLSDKELEALRAKPEPEELAPQAPVKGQKADRRMVAATICSILLLVSGLALAVLQGLEFAHIRPWDAIPSANADKLVDMIWSGATVGTLIFGAAAFAIYAIHRRRVSAGQESSVKQELKWLAVLALGLIAAAAGYSLIEGFDKPEAAFALAAAGSGALALPLLALFVYGLVSKFRGKKETSGIEGLEDIPSFCEPLSKKERAENARHEASSEVADTLVDFFESHIPLPDEGYVTFIYAFPKSRGPIYQIESHSGWGNAAAFRAKMAVLEVPTVDLEGATRAYRLTLRYDGERRAQQVEGQLRQSIQASISFKVPGEATIRAVCEFGMVKFTVEKATGEGNKEHLQGQLTRWTPQIDLRGADGTYRFRIGAGRNLITQSN